MTKGRRPEPDQFSPSTITRDEAFLAWMELEAPSMRVLADYFNKKNEKVSDTTLNRWAKQDKWRDKKFKLGKSSGLKLLEFSSAAAALKALSDEGSFFDIVTAVKGLQSRVVRLMGDKLMDKPDADGKNTEDPKFYIDMTKLLSDLEDVKRRGYQADVQTGARDNLITPPEPKKEPEKHVNGEATVPAMAKVVLRPKFPTPAGKK